MPYEKILLNGIFYGHYRRRLRWVRVQIKKAINVKPQSPITAILAETFPSPDFDFLGGSLVSIRGMIESVRLIRNVAVLHPHCAAARPAGHPFLEWLLAYAVRLGDLA